jgi:hypothetical protein
MSPMGSFATDVADLACWFMSASPSQKRPNLTATVKWRLQQMEFLFDHLVGKREELMRQATAECLAAFRLMSSAPLG